MRLKGKHEIKTWPKHNRRRKGYAPYACKTLDALCKILAIVSGTTIAAVTAVIIYLLS